MPALSRAVRDGRLHWWQLLGGIAGASFVASQALTTPLIGVAPFMVAFVAGQTVGGLGVDALGLGPAGRQRATLARIAGTGLACAFGVQALINMGVAVRLLPAKGMTLPFVSYGGSSVIASGITLGMLLALTRTRPQNLLADVLGRAGR